MEICAFVVSLETRTLKTSTRQVFMSCLFQVHAPGCPVIIVGTHLDQVNVKNTSGLKELVDELYGDSSIYPIIATVTFVSSTAQKLKINSACKQLRKEIYYVATHLFLNKGKSKWLIFIL